MKNISRFYTLMLIVLGLTLVPVFTQAATPALLPPPPPATLYPTTATPTPSVIPVPTIQIRTPLHTLGAWIELHLAFPGDWPWEQQNTDTIFTAVEWQDGQGFWHPVAGWKGTLDKIDVPVDITADNPIVGYKAWWIPKSLLGQGASFRWLVYVEQDGLLLATSAPFELPEWTGQQVAVDVTLGSQ